MDQTIGCLIDEVLSISEDKKYHEIVDSPGRIKVYVGLGRTIYSNMFGFTMNDYYHNVETRLTAQLKAKLFLRENIHDDTVIKPEVGYDCSSAGVLEAGLFGMNGVFEDWKEPYVDIREPVIKNYEDLDKLKIPDFYDHPLMVNVHKEYDKMLKLVDGRMNVSFPGWVRGTWSIALFLRGFTQLYLDIYDNPNFVAELLDFLAEARISWEKQRCEFLGKKPTDIDNWFSNCYIDYRYIHASDQYSDEIDGTMISLEQYSDLIFPSEKKIADFYNRVFYYHSCGNLTKLLSKLVTLPNQSILHVSSWTDLQTAYDETNDNVILQVALHPGNDVLNATPQQIEEKIEKLISIVPDRKLWICADAIYTGDIQKVQDWVSICKQVVARHQ